MLQVPPPSIFSEATKSLSVVIPAYNEEDRLPVTLEDLIGYGRICMCITQELMTPLA